MDYIKKLERLQRLKIALKISFPFIVLVIFVGFVFFQNNYIKTYEIILFSLLCVVYVFYTFYLIYQSFKNSFLDNTLNFLNRKKTEQIFNDLAKNASKNESVVLLKIKNLGEISDIYGINRADEILTNTISNLGFFLRQRNIKSITGHYNASSFLFYIYASSTYLTHILNIFVKKMQNENISVDIDFLAINVNENRDLNKTINFLINELKYKNDIEKDNLYELEKEVLEAIDNSNFIFKIQKILNINDESEVFSLITTIKTKTMGNVARSKFTQINVQNEYEQIFDKNNFLGFLKFANDNKKYIIEISLNSLKNTGFLNFIKDLVDKNELSPNNIIFDFSKQSFENFGKLGEILNEYKKLGFKFSLSQFCGFNISLNEFLGVNFDFITYDISISKNLDDERMQIVLKKFSEIFKGLNIKTIMKFIETKESYNIVKECGVDFVQGYFVQKPKDLVKN